MVYFHFSASTFVYSQIFFVFLQARIRTSDKIIVLEGERASPPIPLSKGRGGMSFENYFMNIYNYENYQNDAGRGADGHLLH